VLLDDDPAPAAMSRAKVHGGAGKAAAPAAGRAKTPSLASQAAPPVNGGGLPHVVAAKEWLMEELFKGLCALEGEDDYGALWAAADGVVARISQGRADFESRVGACGGEDVARAPGAGRSSQPGPSRPRLSVPPTAAPGEQPPNSLANTWRSLHPTTGAAPTGKGAAAGKLAASLGEKRRYGLRMEEGLRRGSGSDGSWEEAAGGSAALLAAARRGLPDLGAAADLHLRDHQREGHELEQWLAARDARSQGAGIDREGAVRLYGEGRLDYELRHFGGTDGPGRGLGGPSQPPHSRLPMSERLGDPRRPLGQPPPRWSPLERTGSGGSGGSAPRYSPGGLVGERGSVPPREWMPPYGPGQEAYAAGEGLGAAGRMSVLPHEQPLPSRAKSKEQAALRFQSFLRQQAEKGEKEAQMRMKRSREFGRPEAFPARRRLA